MRIRFVVVVPSRRTKRATMAWLRMLWSDLLRRGGVRRSKDHTVLDRNAHRRPKGRTSAEEIREVKQSSSALVRSIASTVEQWYLNPTLDLVWKTGFQHVQSGDEAIREAMGADMFRSLLKRRKELIGRPTTFQARGLSSLLARSVKLRSLLTALQVIGGNDLLMKEFLKEISLPKLVKTLLELFDVDTRSIQASEREKLIAKINKKCADLPECVNANFPDNFPGNFADLILVTAAAFDPIIYCPE